MSFASTPAISTTRRDICSLHLHLQNLTPGKGQMSSASTTSTSNTRRGTYLLAVAADSVPLSKKRYKYSSHSQLYTFVNVFFHVNIDQNQVPVKPAGRG